MNLNEIPYNSIDIYKKIIKDYLNDKPYLSKFYSNYPRISSFKDQIKIKNEQNIDRNILVNELLAQYDTIEFKKKVHNNILSLKKKNTYTVCSGHQLSLLTGPLYYIYKILNTINLCEKLNLKYKNYNFVPIFWMHTEDHDFEEINNFNFNNSKIKWNNCHNDFSVTGKISTKSLKEVVDELKLSDKNYSSIINLLKNFYLKNNNLAESTRKTLNYLFSDYGLIIIDPNSKILKKQIIHLIESDILNNSSKNIINQTSDQLGYSQAFARDINFFYLHDNLRSRIIKDGNKYKVMNTEFIFSEQEIKKKINESPWSFSPNVLLRPLYQEVILPNIAVVGGQNEILYWLQLKQLFKTHLISYPILFVRNSAFILNTRFNNYLDNLKLTHLDFFRDENYIFKKFISRNNKNDSHLNNYRSKIIKLYNEFKLFYNDEGIIRSINSELKKNLRSFENFERKILKYQKNNFEKDLNRIKKIKYLLFPDNKPQERVINFFQLCSEDYVNQKKIIYLLKNELDPFNNNLKIILIDK